VKKRVQKEFGSARMECKKVNIHFDAFVISEWNESCSEFERTPEPEQQQQHKRWMDGGHDEMCT
jgi:hypothetical protein